MPALPARIHKDAKRRNKLGPRAPEVFRKHDQTFLRAPPSKDGSTSRAYDKPKLVGRTSTKPRRVAANRGGHGGPPLAGC